MTREETAGHGRHLMVYLVALNTAVLVASVAGGSKIIALPFGLSAAATVFSYAITFTVTDVISEVFGRQAAKVAVRAGFLCMVVAVAFFQVCIWSMPASFWGHQEAYAQTFGMAPRILLGGWTAYLFSQHLDVWIFHRLREWTGGRKLWLRNNGSTLISQLIDTVIFVSIAFGGEMPLLPIIVGQYLIKVTIAAVDTPLVYLAVALMRRNTGERAAG